MLVTVVSRVQFVWTVSVSEAVLLCTVAVTTPPPFDALVPLLGPQLTAEQARGIYDAGPDGVVLQDADATAEGVGDAVGHGQRGGSNGPGGAARERPVAHLLANPPAPNELGLPESFARPVSDLASFFR